MLVSELSKKPIASLTETDTILKAVKIIFNLRVHGIPILRKRKLVGIITEEDILSKLFPSMTEFMEDYIHSTNEDILEKKMNELLIQPVTKIMNKNVRAINSDLPLMRALSIMLANQIGRL